ncbi:Retrovirus-related Pol polyprotein from transposon 17.6, partial [Mucuna pruriens]
MYAYLGYNQIKIHPRDEAKTTSITDAGTFCCKVMPFRLKNARATYQRLMDNIFEEIIGIDVEVYVDDMVVKSTTTGEHYSALERVFQLKLNPEKCSFGVQAGKFLGFMLIERGIEANPKKCQAIINMRSPQTDAERRYQRIEKATLALIITSRRLRTYFQRYNIVVLRKLDLVGRMVVWSIQLSEFDISYENRGHIKAQALVVFITEMTTIGSVTSEDSEWFLFVDGASNQVGRGAGIILEGLNRVLIEQSLHFEFKTSNNQVEYEALLVGMNLAKELEENISLN